MCLAIPGELTELSEREGLRFGKVRFGGISRDVCMEYQPDARVGDFVLVHVGFAISTLNAEEAARTLDVLQQIGQTAELEAELEAIAELRRGGAGAPQPLTEEAEAPRPRGAGGSHTSAQVSGAPRPGGAGVSHASAQELDAPQPSGVDAPSAPAGRKESAR